MNPALLSSKKMDWETPSAFFDELNQEFQFTLDVCATKENAKCSTFYSPEDDALSKRWFGVCWMNPPYGTQIKKWVGKAYIESQNGTATVICLVPARTDTSWWHDFCMKGEIRFVRGRLKFVGAKSPAPFPCAVVVFRAKGAQ